MLDLRQSQRFLWRKELNQVLRETPLAPPFNDIHKNVLVKVRIVDYIISVTAATYKMHLDEL
jgi:hypothetical protein